MATNKKSVTKDYAAEMAKNKRYVYSWLTDGEGYSNFLISDSLSSLNFDVSSAIGTELVDITLNDGNSSSSSLRTVAAGYINLKETGVTSKEFYAPTSLSVQGVDVTAIYGGAVISSNTNNSAYYYGTNTASRYAGIDATVKGDANLSIAAATVTTVYGGGAGYGSELDGDVNLKFTSTNRIGTVYGGGQKGAVVNGDVNITVSRADATEGGRIGTIYGGGDNAVVNGDVYITVEGTNAVTVGTISGSGKGNKARVTGTRTLEIADYSGKFATNIKDFDTIKITGSSSVVLTQTQNKTIQSAKYEFVLDNEALSVGQKSAMLRWDKDVDLGQIIITIDGELDNVENGFSKTIYASTYATSDIINNILVRTKKADGTYALSSAATSVYDLEFVADTDSKGNAKAKGGYVVLNYSGSKVVIDATSTEDKYLSEQGEQVSIKPGTDAAGNVVDTVRTSVNAAGGDDTVTIQTNTVMAGDIELGTGENTLRIQGDAEMTGSIIVDKNSTNKIFVNGTISQIEGGDETTKNFVYINTPNAIGYYKYSTDVNDKDATGAEQRFIPQALVFTGKSEDTVYLSEVATNIPAISFGEGKDTLVLNTSLSAMGSDTRITSDDGNDAIIANQTGITIDADKLKLAGTDNIFVVTNGVKATVNGVALGNFEGQYKGIYLGQNALLTVNDEDAVQSYDGDLYLNRALTILTAPTASDELKERIGTYYTIGSGVNANIEANGQTITVREGAAVKGTIIGAVDLYFKGANDATAGAELFFDNDGTKNAAKIRVAKNVLATVASVNGIAGTTYEGADDFENDSAQVTLNENAALYAAQDENLLVGNITKATDFSEKYGDLAKGTISVIGAVKAGVKFTDAKIYAGGKASFEGGIKFAGTNTMDVKTGKLVLDNKQMFFEDAAKVDFNVQDGAELVFDGIVKGGTYDHDKINVNLGKNARFAMGDTLNTASWSDEFNASKLDGRTVVNFAEKSVVDNKINLEDASSALTVNIAKDALVKGDLGAKAEDAGVITLGKGADTLNIDAATVDGVIDASNDTNTDLINLKGSTVNGMAAPKDEIAVKLGDTDELNATDGALVNGDVTGGNEIYIKDSEVTGSISAKSSVLNNAKVGSIVKGNAFVESGSTTETNTSTIGAVDVSTDGVTVYADVATAKIGEIKGVKGNGKAATLIARNKGTVALQGVDAELDTAMFGAIHEGSAVDFGGDVKLVADDVALAIENGGAFKNLGNVEVAGGIDNVSASDLQGELTAATSAAISSRGGAAITAKDVTFVAKDSEIAIESEDTVNTFGKIFQSGAIKQDGYGRTTTYGQATSAKVELKKNASFTKDSTLTADSITQYAETSTVDVTGTANVAGGIAQTGDTATVKVVGTANVAAGIKQDAATAAVTLEGTANVAGGIEQLAETSAAVTLTGAAEIAAGIVQKASDPDATPLADADVTISGTANTTVKQEATDAAVTLVADADVATVGAVDQAGTTKADVIARAKIAQKYDGTEKFSEALADKNIDKLERTVGAVTQTGDANTVELGAGVEADGTYATGLHKAAKVNIGSVALKNGDVTQTGKANTVSAIVNYDAKGESDVKIGATALEMGAITQTIDEKNDDGTLNAVEIKTTSAVSADSVMELGDIAGKVGAISQKAYKAGNKVDINIGKSDDETLKAVNVALETAGISMLAYGNAEATNDLDLAGNVTVKGDVKVGGVVEDEHISVDSSWGDRTAAKNTVDIATNTVTLEKDLSMVGLENELTLKNDTYFTGGDTTTKQVAQNITLAGQKNTIDVAAGVKMDNISLYDLKDYDKIGKEGYDLTDGTGYTNKITLRGEAAKIENKYAESNDELYVYGGKIDSDVITKNGNDVIKLGNDAAEFVMGDSTITGNVVMGVKGEAAGTNEISMQAFEAKDLANTEKAVAHNVAIGGSVEMYSGLKDDAAAKNTLSLAGLGTATATIGGSVTMDAANAYNEDGSLKDYNKQGINKITMGPLSKIGGDVTMTAYASNEIDVDASEEIVKEADAKAYAEITGKVAMTAKNNTISVAGAAASPSVAKGAAAYMNGITMANKYTAADGKEYLNENAVNAITVGTATFGSELIVGTSVDATADVKMGTIAFKKADVTTTYDVESITKDAKGHDLVKYLNDTSAIVTGITDTNSITVKGRFDANDVTMMADKNTVDVKGDGSLGKIALFGGTIEDWAKVSDEVRTASFTANDVMQIGGTTNSITAKGTGWVSHFGYVEDPLTGNQVLDETGKLASVEFTTGKITQAQYGKTATVNNTVSLTGSIVATTGDITQAGNGDNAVTVETYDGNDALGAPRSLVGNIAQGTADQLAASNSVRLERTDVGTANGWIVTPGTITQFADGPNAVSMLDSTSGAIAQTSSSDDRHDGNTVYLNTSTTASITQTAAEGYNSVNAYGNVWDSATAEYQTSEIDGDIAQTTAQTLKKDVLWNSNVVLTANANISGSITQTGVNENTVDVSGAVNKVDFKNDADEDKQFEKAFNVKVGGDITQNAGIQNIVNLKDATVGGKIAQTGTDVNAITAEAEMVAYAENKGVSPDTDEYQAAHGDTCEHHAANTHVSTTIKSQADFNTLAIKGDITQTAGATDEVKEAAVYVTPKNAVDVRNMNLANITQTNADGYNTIAVNATGAYDGTMKKIATYEGEIDATVDLKPVTYVKEYTVNQTTAVGDVMQTGVKGGTDSMANSASLKGVKAGSVTQIASEQGNDLLVSAVADVNKEVVDVMTWDKTKGGVNKEVTTATVLEGSDNVRAGNTLGAITQTTAASGNYADAAQIKNQVNLTNTTVNGAVSQKAVAAQDANVKNDFDATTVKQHFVDVKAIGDVQTKIEYDQVVMDDINGSLTQVGYENEANLADVNVKGDVVQTTNMISTTAHHGAQLAGQKAGGNDFTIDGDKNVWADDAERAAYDAMGLKQEFKIAEVTGNVTQTINNNGEQVNPDKTSNIATLAANNTVTGNLAAMGDVAQTLTWGNNSVSLTGDTIAADVRTPATVDKDHPEVINAQMQIGSASAKSITQTATQVANAEGRFDTDNTAQNYVYLDTADSGDVTQAGTGLVQNVIAYEGALFVEKKINAETGKAEDVAADLDQKTVNTLGNVDQASYSNDASVRNAKKVGTVKQTAMSVAYTDTDTSTPGTEKVTLGKLDTYNSANIHRIDEVGDITQTAESVKYQQTVITNGVAADSTDEVTSAYNSVTVCACGYDLIAKGGNVKQEVIGDGMKGSNYFYADNAALGTIDQTTGDGTNGISLYADYLTHDIDLRDKVSAGNITQVGDGNTLYTEEVKVGAVSQTTTNVSVGDSVQNYVYMDGSVTTEKYAKDDPTAPYDETDNPYRITKQPELWTASAESITQVYNAKELMEGFYSATESTRDNEIDLYKTNVGFVNQSGTGKTYNDLYFSGAEVETKEIDTVTVSGGVETVTTKTVSVDRPNTIGVVDQKGYANGAWIYDAASAGTVTQTSATFAAVTSNIDPNDPTKKVDDTLTYYYYAGKFETTGLDNNLRMSDVAAAGEVVQTVNAEEFDVKYYDYDATAKTYVETKVDTGTANGDNYFYAVSSNIGNVTQKQIGKDGYAATGDNTISADYANLGNIVQVAIAGGNDIDVDTNTTAGTETTLAVKASKTVGTVSQTGAVNDFDADDVKVGATIQTAQAVDANDYIANAFDIDGVITSATKALVDETDPSKGYKLVADSELVSASVDSITQTVTSADANQGWIGTEVYYKSGASLMRNDVDLENADAGAITQSGTGPTTNDITVEGSVVYAHKIDTDKTTVVVDTEKAAIRANVVGKLSQSGQDNDIDVEDVSVATKAADGTLTAQDIIQTASSFDTIDLSKLALDDDGDGEPDNRYFSTGKYAGTLANDIYLDTVALAGNVTQTVNAETFTIKEYDAWSNGLPTETTAYVNGTNTFDADASNVGTITQTGAKTNKVTLNESVGADDAVTTGAITQVAAIAGDGQLYNEVQVRDGSAVASVSQTAKGEKTDTVNTKGINFVLVTKADVGAIDQTAAGDKMASNTLSVKEGATTLPASKTIPRPDTSKAPAADNAESFENNEFVNTIGAVTQKLDSLLKVDDFEDIGDKTKVLDTIKAAGLKNEITIDNYKSTGLLSQDATRSYGDVETIGTFAINTITVTASLAKDPTMMQYEVPTTGANAWKAVDSGNTVKTEVAGISQKGFVNSLTLSDVKLTGDIYTLGKFYKETDALGKSTYVAPKTSSEITLTRVEAGDITAATDAAIKIEGNVIALDSKITLTDTKVVGDITTDEGSDTITLDGKTTIIGTIDMDTFEKDKDTLNVNVKDIDLTQATIENVEVLNVSRGSGDPSTVELTAKSIDAESIVNTSGSGKGVITASNIEVKSMTGFGTKCILQGMNEGLGDDTLTLEGTLGTTTVRDFEDVTFANGSTGANITWQDTSGTGATQGSIDFHGITFGSDGNFAIGSFTDYENKDLTFNDLEYDGEGTLKGWCASGKTIETLTSGDVYYTKSGTTLTTHTVA